MELASQLLKQYFGYDTFRSMQREIIQSVLDKKDTVVLMPTGGGKSMCFQIPALMFDGITIVVSPLLSLQKDQVDSLRINGIKAEYLNSSLTLTQEQEVLQRCFSGETKLLYVSPEKLLLDIALFKTLNVSLFAIDEAHCISAWGHDFRPEYTKLKLIKSHFNNIPIIALTATADKTTRVDIINQLGLSNPEIFISSFDRPNLSLDVKIGLSSKEKNAQIITFILKRKNQPGIIYCLSRKITEQVAQELLKVGISATVYHAGMSSDQRAEAQDDFINDKVQVVCATVAFGMGIDKSNVRWVIHYNLPKNIESFYQEIGRAGRDGLKSDTILFYNYGDLTLLKTFAVESVQKDLNLEKLRRMQQYAEADFCRRKILINYFGEQQEHNCENCDVCKNPRAHFNGTVIVQKALSALARVPDNIGLNMLVDILRGSQQSEIMQKGYDKIKTYGAGADISKSDWQQYIMQMINLGYAEIIYQEGFVVKATPLGTEILFGNKEAMLVVPQKIDFEKKGKVSKTKKLVIDNTPEISEEDQMWEVLRRLRREFADIENVPAYAIFSDATLAAMISSKPDTMLDFMAIPGVGQRKMEKYGDAFLLEMSTVRNRYASNLKTKKVDTFQQTLELINKGLSISEIAKQRELAESTIMSQISTLYQKGMLKDISSYVSKQEIKIVLEAKSLLGTDKLKDIFDHLNGSINYFKIRLALSTVDKI